MDILKSYEALSTSPSKRSEVSVTAVLQSIVDAPPVALTSTREALAQRLLDDIAVLVADKRHHTSSRLARKVEHIPLSLLKGIRCAHAFALIDAQLALLALKTLGRTTSCSRIIAKRENLVILLNATEKCRGWKDADAADESLRCVANALLLVDTARATWVEVHGADHCVELLEKSTSPSILFLACRILFLSTASSTSSFIPTLLDSRQASSSKKSTRDYIKHDIVDIIGTKLDVLLSSVVHNTPMGKEAMIDLLKLSFNLLCHWPKMAADAEPTSEAPPSGKGKGKAARTEKAKPEDDLSVLGERWSNRLNGLLAPLLRVFLGLPSGSTSPLAPPMTHILHSLLPIPLSSDLYTTWFPENNFQIPNSRRSSSSKKRDPSPGTHKSSGKPPSLTSRSSSPGSGSSNVRDQTKEKERGNSPLDRALSMLSPRPRISLSSRSTSPIPLRSPANSSPVGNSPAQSSPPSAYPRTTGGEVGSPSAVFTRAVELLGTSFAHYLPGAVDPDDKVVKQRCIDEDIELDHVLSPLVLLVTKLCKYNAHCRKALREAVLPADLDRTKPLEGRADTLGHCIRLMACINHARLKEAAGELLFTICDSDAQAVTAEIGYGNAAGYLFNRGLLAPPPAASTGDEADASSSSATAQSVNPITGMVERPRQPVGAEMTEEEKEREADKLFVLFERLEKAGGMENPIKKALREGALEKYDVERRKKEERDDDGDG